MPSASASASAPTNVAWAPKLYSLIATFTPGSYCATQDCMRGIRSTAPNHWPIQLSST